MQYSLSVHVDDFVAAARGPTYALATKVMCELWSACFSALTIGSRLNSAQDKLLLLASHDALLHQATPVFGQHAGTPVVICRRSRLRFAGIPFARFCCAHQACPSGDAQAAQVARHPCCRACRPGQESCEGGARLDIAISVVRQRGGDAAGARGQAARGTHRQHAWLASASGEPTSCVAVVALRMLRQEANAHGGLCRRREVGARGLGGDRSRAARDRHAYAVAAAPGRRFKRGSRPRGGACP